MNKYSYITLLTDDSYIYGVILLNESLKNVNSQYPLEILVTSNVSKPIINILEQLQLKYSIIKPIKNEQFIDYNIKIMPQFAKTWSLCLSKIEIFNLIQFDKIVFLDADILVLKNLDHLFDYPHLTSAIDGEYFNLWPDDPHFNAGILVIEPNQQEYNNISNYISNFSLDDWNKFQCIADQEILNLYFSEWIKHTELHLNKYYDIFAPYIQQEQLEDIKKNCYFIHFIGRKPWRTWMRSKTDTYSEETYIQAHEIIQNCVNKLDWDQAKDQIKIAVYAICKDEIQSVANYIACFSKADYLCILDTGSTDGTWEYLQKAKSLYPNLIIEQQIISPWRYDSARNISLKLIPEDTTILFMADLDEIIKEDNWPFLIKAKWNPFFKRGSYTYNRRVDPQTDAVIQSFTEYRIHSKDWHYKGIVHEQLCDITNSREIMTEECISVPISVWHYPTKEDKSIYIELCEKGVEEEPFNWIMHLQLAIEYEINHKNEQAINEYRKIIAEENSLSPSELGRCYAGLGKLLSYTNGDAALAVYEKGIKNVPNFGDNYFFAAELCYKKLNFEKTYSLCIEGLKHSDDTKWCTVIEKESSYPYILMGLSQFYMNHKILGLGYLAIAKEKNNNDELNNIYNEVINEIIKGGEYYD